MITTVKDLKKNLRTFKDDDIIEISGDSIIYVQSAHLKKRKISESSIFSLHASGKGPAEIGELLGCSKQYVVNIIDRRKKVIGDL